MASDRRDYLITRAAEERAAAANSPKASIAEVQEDMARMYDRMLKQYDLDREFRLEPTD